MVLFRWAVYRWNTRERQLQSPTPQHADKPLFPWVCQGSYCQRCDPGFIASWERKIWYVLMEFPLYGFWRINCTFQIA